MCVHYNEFCHVIDATQLKLMHTRVVHHKGRVQAAGVLTHTHFCSLFRRTSEKRGMW
jgi:hypothetical protein